MKPTFSPDLFSHVREAYHLQELIKLQKEAKELKNIIRAYKGHTTKRKKKA